MPGLIKIGRTDQEADARLSQLYTTGVPVPFKCVMAVKPERSAAEVEQALHQAFESHRLKPRPRVLRGRAGKRRGDHAVTRRRRHRSGAGGG